MYFFFSNFQTAKKGKSKNVLLSPLSVNLALGMIASGAKGNTKREILETLHLQENDEQTKSSYENIFLNLMVRILLLFFMQ